MLAAFLTSHTAGSQQQCRQEGRASSSAVLLPLPPQGLAKAGDRSLRTYDINIRRCNILRMIMFHFLWPELCRPLTCSLNDWKCMLIGFISKCIGILVVVRIRKQGYVSGNWQPALGNMRTEVTGGEVISTVVSVLTLVTFHTCISHSNDHLRHSNCILCSAQEVKFQGFADNTFN